MLRTGTIPEAGGYGLVTAENGEERENAKRAGPRSVPLERNFRRPRPIVALLAILGCGLQIPLDGFQSLEIKHGLPIYSIEVRETDEAILDCDSGDFMYDERFKDYKGVGRHHLELGD